jgi:protein-S-isoprenylcysteine O-methyltransferase Ste14
MTVAIGRFFFRYRNALFPCAIALALLPGPDTFASPLVAALLGALVALAGQSIRILTIGLDYIVRGGRGGKVYADQLVTGGLFAHCRNPLYLGNLTIILGLAVASNSLAALVAAPPLFLFAYHCIIRAEEEFLLGKFGDEYRAYCRSTPRLGVRFAGLAGTVRAMQFHWRRVVVKEYGTPVAWIIGIVVLATINLAARPGLQQSQAPILGLAGVVGVAVAAWLFVRYLKKTRRLVGD